MSSHAAGGPEGAGGEHADVLPFKAPRPEKYEGSASVSTDETLDPKEVSRSENVDWLLSELTHPSIAGKEPTVTAEYIIKYLKPFPTLAELERLTEQDKARREELLTLSLDSLDLTDEQLHAFATEDPVYAAMQETRDSLNRSYAGHRERRQALLALEQLRMGVVVANIETDEDKWILVTRKLATNVRR